MVNNSSPPLTLGTRREALLAQHPWLTFLLPFIVFMAAGSMEPGPPKVPPGVEAVDEPSMLGIRYAHYPIIYTVKIALTLAAMAFVLPGYRQFAFRVSPLAIGIGLLGGVLWIGIANLQLERHLVEAIGPESTLVTLLGLGERSAYSPLEQLVDTPGWAYAFLAIRFVGLVLIVPVIEEFFLRGFLMRYVIRDEWWKVPFGDVTTLSLVIGTAFPVLYHPEKLAAVVWFSMVTWLMVKTRNIWDCVAAHAVTNLVLGVYVVIAKDWRLW